MNCLVVGASAGLGRALCEALAVRGHSILMVASDLRDLQAEAANLTLLYGIRVETVAVSIGPNTDWHRKVTNACNQFGEIYAALFPIGYSSDRDLGDSNEEL